MAVVVDDVQAYADDDGYEVAREDADGASSRPARRVPVGFRCAEATSHFRGSSFQGCDRHPRHPCRRDNSSLDCPTQNFRPLKHNANREPFQSAPDLGGCAARYRRLRRRRRRIQPRALLHMQLRAPEWDRRRKLY